MPARWSVRRVKASAAASRWDGLLCGLGRAGAGGVPVVCVRCVGGTALWEPVAGSVSECARAGTHVWSVRLVEALIVVLRQGGTVWGCACTRRWARVRVPALGAVGLPNTSVAGLRWEVSCVPGPVGPGESVRIGSVRLGEVLAVASP